MSYKDWNAAITGADLPRRRKTGFTRFVEFLFIAVITCSAVLIFFVG